MENFVVNFAVLSFWFGWSLALSNTETFQTCSESAKASHISDNLTARGESKMTVDEELAFAVANGTMTQAQADEIKAQRDHFNTNRTQIETNYPGEAAGVADFTIFHAPNLSALIQQISAAKPGKLSYAEFPVGKVQ